MTGESRATALLALAVVAMAGVDALVHRPRAAPPEATVLRVDPAAVGRVRLQAGDTITELTRAGGTWRVVAPYEAPADGDRVAQVLAPFAGGVTIGPRLDELTDDNDDAYGLDNATAIRLDLDDTALYIGADGPGGASFVRLIGEDTVYTARLGGRWRYDRQTADWRDRRIVQFDPADVDAIGLAGTFRLARTGAGWRADADPTAIDAPAVDELLAAIGSARALELDVTAPDVPPAATLTLELGDAAPIALSVWAPDLVGVDGDVTRVPPELVAAIARPLADYADRRLLSVDPAAVSSVLVEADAARSRFERGADGTWTRAEPHNVGLDASAVDAAVARIAAWRAEGWLHQDVAPDAPRIVLATAEGGIELRIGPRDPDDPERRAVSAGGRTAWVRGVDADVAALR